MNAPAAARENAGAQKTDSLPRVSLKHSRAPLFRRAALLLACAVSLPLLAQKPTQEQLRAALNDPYNIAWNEGYQAESRGKHRAALEAYERAVELAGSNPSRQVSALSRRAAMRAKFGLWKQGRADVDAALALDPTDLTAQFALLELARGQGDFRTAATTLERLRTALAKVNDKRQRVLLAFETARTTAAWGDLHGALQQFEESAPQVGDASDFALVARLHREMAQLRLRLNDPTGARAGALEALGADLRRVGTSRRRPVDDWLARGDRAVAESLLALADAQLVLGEREAALTNYRTVWKLALKLVTPNELYRADLGAARVSLDRLRRGEPAPSLASDLASVIDLTRYDDFPAIQFEALGLLGEIHLQQGKSAEAVTAFQRAIAQVETHRAAATAEEKRHYLAMQADFYRWLLEAYLQQGDAWSALAASEALKARQLRETLTPTEAASETFAQTLARLRSLPAQLAADTAVISYANADWSQTEPVAFVLTQGRLASVRLPVRFVPEVADALPRDMIIAAQKHEVDVQRYHVGDEITLAGLVAFLRSCIYCNDCSPEELNARVKPMFATARSLHALLLAPFEDRLKGTSRLLVSTSGLLAYLPFDLLIGVNGRALVEDYAVTLTPSLLVSQALAERPPATYARPMLAFGGAVYDPSSYDRVMADVPAMKQQFDQLVAVRQAVFSGSPYAGRFGPQSNLAGTKTEVLMLGELLPGTRIEVGRGVSESNIRALAAAGELQNSRVIHFAVHGMALPAMPELSGIILSYENPTAKTPPERDGFLQITEIEKLPLRAELVTLSACETGLGAIIAGEGVVGLTSSLFQAGADAVLASLWPVSDASSVYFMQRFYQHHLVDGVPPDVAVALVKREFITGKAGNGFRHPQHWAPFNLYGGRESLNSPARAD